MTTRPWASGEESHSPLTPQTHWQVRTRPIYGALMPPLESVIPAAADRGRVLSAPGLPALGANPQGCGHSTRGVSRPHHDLTTSSPGALKVTGSHCPGGTRPAHPGREPFRVEVGLARGNRVLGGSRVWVREGRRERGRRR